MDTVRCTTVRGGGREKLRTEAERLCKVAQHSRAGAPTGSVGPWHVQAERDERCVVGGRRRVREKDMYQHTPGRGCALISAFL